MWRITSDIYFESEGNFLPESIVAKLQEKDYEIKRLPLLEVPREVLEKDENLRNQPLYEAKNKTHTIFFGDRVLGISIENVEKIENDKVYKFAEFIEENFKITRLGVRATNLKSPIAKEKIKVLINEKIQEFDDCFLRLHKKYKHYEFYVTFNDNKEVVTDIIVFIEQNLQKKEVVKKIEFLVSKIKEIYDAYGV